MNTTPDQDDDGVLHVPVSGVEPEQTSVTADAVEEEEEDDIIDQAPVATDQTDVTLPTDSAPDSTETTAGTEASAAPEEEDLLAPSEIESESEDSGQITYPAEVIDFRGETLVNVNSIIEKMIETLGPATFDARSRTPGTFENILTRSALDVNFEEHRAQEALAALTPEDRESMSYRLMSGGEKKTTLLRTSKLGPKLSGDSSVINLTGRDALLAFENVGAEKRPGGGYRIVLYNSGISLDILTPTNNDFDTLITNCNAINRELGAATGAHYYTYNDLLYKSQIIAFLQPLILDTSYDNWRKNNNLWSVIKIPDLSALVMTLAALAWPDGYDNFLVRCFNVEPVVCGHTQRIKADLFKMITTRWSVLSDASIKHLVAARQAVGHKHSVQEIAKYQAGLGLEGEKITIGDFTFVMRIPTLTEHIDAGSTFLSDVLSEIQGDNTEGQYRQMGFRYIRSFLPWIGAMEAAVSKDGKTIRTSDVRAITRILEHLDKSNPEETRKAFVDYTEKVQLTWVGYPILKCEKCGHQAETPSGLYTFDPFAAFFTLASQYTK